MSDKSKIEWTDATWNPVRGCSRVSEGCRHCYAERIAGRFSGPGMWAEGIVNDTPAGPRWNGNVYLAPDKMGQPLRWKRPRRVFVNSMSDLFHEGLSDQDIGLVFDVMWKSPQHTFQVLTKRPERMREWFRWAGGVRKPEGAPWPLPNVWLGVSVEDQGTAAARIPLLLATPAAVRFVSAEPLLGEVNLLPWMERCPYTQHVNGWQHGWHFDGDAPRVICAWCGEMRDALTDRVYGQRHTVPGLDWVIVGGESGPGARPMHPDWARALRDQCEEAAVAFFFKQWGEWAPGSQLPTNGITHAMTPAGVVAEFRKEAMIAAAPHVYSWEGLRLVGKRAAGRLLDGQEHSAFPGGAV